MTTSQKNINLLKALDLREGETYTNYQGESGRYFYDARQTGLFIPDSLLTDLISLMKFVSKHHNVLNLTPEPVL
jgi:hypothetical protein